MIKTIVLDIGNVLVQFRWKECLQDLGYEEEIIRKVSSATVLNRIWKEWDRGILGKDEIIRQCCRLEPGVENEIIDFFNHHADFVKEYDYSADFVRNLKDNGYQVYLLSNYSKWSFEYDKERFKFSPYVDGGVISYEINHIKPEPEIYEALIKKYNITPAKAVFLDDLQDNLEGAKPFGFHTILVKSFEQAVKELRKLGVRI